MNATGTEAQIRCESLVRIFKADGVEVQALQGLELEVAGGEMVALVGASGSGKSTLLNILAGLDKPTAGEAFVAGHDLLAMRGKERVSYQRHTVGFVWQETSRNLLPYLSAEENIAVPMIVSRKLGRKQRRERVGELVELFGLGDCRDHRPQEMSGGEQQRTAIATAVANSPQVLLADEPTGELDEANSDNVLAAMEHANTELGVTVLIVTHDPLVSQHVARTVQIRDGRTSSEVLRRKEVDEHGAEQHIAEEFAVVDRVGRLQLPGEFIGELDIRDRVRLALEPDHIGVWPDGTPRSSNGEERADD
jgi:ABC-type lipoprotein export system ATPase subunit